MSVRWRAVNRLIARFTEELYRGGQPNRQEYLTECPEEERAVLVVLMDATEAIYRHPDRSGEVVSRLSKEVAHRLAG